MNERLKSVPLAPPLRRPYRESFELSRVGWVKTQLSQGRICWVKTQPTHWLRHPVAD